VALFHVQVKFALRVLLAAVLSPYTCSFLVRMLSGGPGSGEADMDGPSKFWRRRSGKNSASQDPLEHVTVGDPDLGTATGHRKCEFEWTDQTLPLLILHWRCTRALGHSGQHLAGTGEWIAAVHPPLLPASCSDDPSALSSRLSTQTQAAARW
jgi:hypothetical protein